jgi:hypothetical protein
MPLSAGHFRNSLTTCRRSSGDNEDSASSVNYSRSFGTWNNVMSSELVTTDPEKVQIV